MVTTGQGYLLAGRRLVMMAAPSMLLLGWVDHLVMRKIKMMAIFSMLLLGGVDQLVMKKIKMMALLPSMLFEYYKADFVCWGCLGVVLCTTCKRTRQRG